jgi:multiple sugar transport system permease protein
VDGPRRLPPGVTRLTGGQFGVLLVLPALALFGAVVLYPFVAALVSGFFEQSLIAPGREFVGLANYRDVLADDFWSLLRNTLVFAVGATVIPFLLGLVLALALNVGFRGTSVLRGLFLLPWVVPAVVVSFLWLWIFNANYGLLNGILVGVGLDSIAWLGRPDTAMAAVIIAKTWATFPWMMVMLLAGLQSIPTDLYEAAGVDGASALQRFRAITWPHLRPIAAIVALLELIWNFQHFDTIFVLTGGGPAGATRTFSVAVYETAFEGFDLGRAGALGGLWVLILSLLVGGYLWISERRQEG